MFHPFKTIALATSLLTFSLFSGSTPLAAQSTDQLLTPRTFIDVSKKVLPAVVSIQVENLPSKELMERYDVETFEELQRKLQQNNDLDAFAELWRNFEPGMFGSSGSGSGVVVRRDGNVGYIVTNKHVLSTSDRVYYTLIFDESISEERVKVKGEDVTIVGMDELTDLAVIKFNIPEGVNIPVAEFADSNKVEIGEWVLALGNPLDLNNSVSQGIISAKNRNISNGARIEELLQTTAVINPGNSGGPLVNLEGQIVGINNAIATSTGRWAGIGFAIPANQAERVSAMLIEKGRVTRGYLGIQMEDAPDEKGVEVMYVNADTPAMEVGLKEGDIVRRVNGERIYNRRDLLTAIGNRLAGEEVKLSIIRTNGEQVEEKDLNVVLAERPSEETLSQLNIPSRRGGAQISPFFQDSPDLGITENFFEKFGFSIDTEAEVEEGIKVGTVTEGSEAEKAGLKAGDTLVQINGITITDEQSILDGFANVNPGDEHFVLFQRDGNNQFIRIPQ